MNTPWNELFRRLDALQLKVYGHWQMSNGSEFLFALPLSIHEDGNKFTDDIEFPFTFDEIRRIDIPRLIGRGIHGLTNDLDSVIALFPIQGLRLEESADVLRIIID